MPWTLAYTQHCGNNPDQQDTLWSGLKIYQHRDLAPLQHASDADEIFAAVADGVANSPAPQRASRAVLESLAADIAAGRSFNASLLRRAHGRLCDTLARGRSYGSATTLTAAACRGDRCTVVSVGDSRAYRVAADGQWEQITRDHTILNRLIDEGVAEDGVAYAGFYGMLDSCLTADDADTDFPIHYSTTALLPGDALLLCTDGVHDTLGDQLAALFDREVGALAQVRHWREAILAAGAPDNFSLVLIERTA